MGVFWTAFDGTIFKISVAVSRAYPQNEEDMKLVSYASVVGSLIYAILYSVVQDTNDEDPSSYEEATVDSD